jgi:hypothetical protein
MGARASRKSSDRQHCVSWITGVHPPFSRHSRRSAAGSETRTLPLDRRDAASDTGERAVDARITCRTNIQITGTATPWRGIDRLVADQAHLFDSPADVERRPPERRFPGAGGAVEDCYAEFCSAVRKLTVKWPSNMDPSLGTAFRSHVGRPRRSARTRRVQPYDLRRTAPTTSATPINATIGPMMDQVMVLLIGLPPTTPKPCSAHSRPNNATITPMTPMAMRMLSL